MNIFNDHKKLYPIAGLLFLCLTLMVVILPALDSQKNNAPLPGSKPLTALERQGKLIYISEGCVACHSQQVRNVAMDKIWGSRPGLAADYANIGRTSIWQNTATLMGTERTGPDLTDVGNRQPSQDWNLMHLYNPRIVVQQSIMPSYHWLFELKDNPDSTEIIVPVPASFLNGKKGKVVATENALALVAYLKSLKQVPLPSTMQPNAFLMADALASNEKSSGGQANEAVDGKKLYTTYCQTCHQENGEGLKGAYPPLKGSAVVTGNNLDLYIDIIMNGYDARAEYGVMSAVGVNANFTEKEVAAIINYERTSWGNKGQEVKPEDIKKIVDFVKLKAQAQ
ncbi:MAG: cbb3-type cytochrome c oxidase subunit II [Alphaproteobacteria bacterium]|nr:cbb3-type cytochrome c oxidase subunit II [Alphaproteobacteria bacterium]